jgi:hypothetical protein
MFKRLCVAMASIALGSMPATAQIFWQGPDFRGNPLVPGEPNMGITLPGATVAEERANWAWQMRAALNVAKLQCKFEPVLLASDSYDGVYINHAVELADAYNTLRKYFVRTTRTPRAAQQALDQYGTKTYSGFSTVGSQLGFCQTAGRLGKKAQFVPRGAFTIFTVEHLRELRNSLAPGGENLFRRTRLLTQFATPQFINSCWDRRGNYRRNCGTVYL